MNVDVRVSAVVAAHNHEAFVGDALRSLIAQTYGPLDLVVIDDGSTDGTFDRVQQLLSDLRQRFAHVDVSRQDNAGSAATLSRCIERAAGDLIFVLDSDDVALPHAIERLLASFNKPDVALAVGDNTYIDANGNPCFFKDSGRRFETLLAWHTRDRSRFDCSRDFGSYASLIRGNYVPNGWLLRRSCVEAVGGYRPELTLDDWPLLLRLSKRYRIVYAGEVLAKYRVHTQNTYALRREQLLLDSARILLEEQQYCVAHGLEGEWRDLAARILAPPTSDGVPPTADPPPESRGLRIHLYTACWNDVRMLPFFFRHYDPFVQRYVVFDDGSTDGSLELLRAHPRVEIREFAWTHRDSFVLSELAHYDHCWKESRGQADWVIVTDVDEHLYHPRLAEYLRSCMAQGVTVVPAHGFEMVTDRFPGASEQLCEAVPLGAPDAGRSKLQIFSPDAVHEIRYEPGGHSARPIGRILAPPRDEVLLLHHKLLGEEYVRCRHEQLRSRLGPTDVANRWAVHWSDRALDSGVEYRSQLVDIRKTAEDAPADTPVWWAHLPRAEDHASERKKLAEALDAERTNRARADHRVGQLEAALANERQRRETEAAVAAQERARLEKGIAVLSDRVRALEQSRTWRWTKSARRVVDLVLAAQSATQKRQQDAAISRTVAADARAEPLTPPVDAYDAWLSVNAWKSNHADLLRLRLRDRGPLPRISIVTPVFRPSPTFFLQTAASVRGQVYENWEWCLCDDASGDRWLQKQLRVLARQDRRIRIAARSENGHISRAANGAAALATGEFLAFLDHDDLLSPDALAEVALHLAECPDIDVLYTDDDKVGADGRRFGPQFKPDWSPESLLSQMYFCHLLVVRRSLFERVGGFRTGFEGSQDHDLALRATEQARAVGHLPLVLYHWRAAPGSTAASGNAKPYSFDATVRAVNDAFERRGLRARASRPDWAVRAGASLVRHEFPDDGPSVAILIPSRNGVSRLRRCLASLDLTSYGNYEVTILDDQSDDPATIAFLGECGRRVIRRSDARNGFNFSAVCNHGAHHVESDYLLFLNDDVEIRTPGWLSQMIGLAQASGVGAVGARLLFPGGTVQHAGILHGFNQGSLALAFRGLPADDPGYLAASRVCRNYGAVTAACMLTPRTLFLEHGGFDEVAFPESFNDVDYCYRLAETGYRCVYAAEAELIHHEGASRGRGSDASEIARFRERYRDHVEHYFNPNLSRANERFEVQPRRLARGPNRPVSTAIISHALDITGAPLCQLDLAVALLDRRVIRPVVISPFDGPLRSRYERAGIPVRVLPSLDGLGSREDYERTISRLIDELRDVECGVIWASTLKTFFGIDAARRLGIPSVWSIRESEPWSTYYSYLPPPIEAVALGCFSAPYRVVFGSNGTRSVFEPLNSHHNFCVVHDGLSLDGWRDIADPGARSVTRQRLGINDSDVVVLTVGTVCERKGQHDVVRSLMQIDRSVAAQVRCLIVGDRPGEYSGTLSDLANGLPPELRTRVSIIRETDDVRNYYLAADVFVCTSRIESYPRVILEAMASGLPIISTPVYGIAEQLSNGVNAQFYEPGDIDALAAALTRMVADPHRRSEMARQSRIVFRGLKSFDETVADYACFLREASEL